MTGIIRVSLRNSAGELDFRLVTPSEGDDAEAGIKDAALELLNEAPYLSVGDQIIVTEKD